jgi:hypothetical protein
MQKLIQTFKLLTFILCFNSFMSVAEVNIKPEVVAKAKKSIVTIQSRISMSAYKFPGSWSGTGFVVDKRTVLL